MDGAESPIKSCDLPLTSGNCCTKLCDVHVIQCGWKVVKECVYSAGWVGPSATVTVLSVEFLATTK